MWAGSSAPRAKEIAYASCERALSKQAYSKQQVILENAAHFAKGFWGAWMSAPDVTSQPEGETMVCVLAFFFAFSCKTALSK